MIKLTSTVQTLTTNFNLIVTHMKETPSGVSFFVFNIKLYEAFYYSVLLMLSTQLI